MTDKTGTGESAAGNVVAGEATRHEREVLDGIRAASDGIGVIGEHIATDVLEALSDVGDLLGPPKQTWRDWLPAGEPPTPDDELITRGELLARLRDVDVDLTARTLQSWEQLGIMPRPIRLRRDGGNWSFYAPWVVYIGRFAAMLKVQGIPLEAISERTRWMVPSAIYRSRVWTEVMADGRLHEALQEIAERFESVSGERLDTINVRMDLAKGETWEAYTFRVPD